MSAVGASLREVRARGLEALELATALLQRARLVDSEGGLWEAADVQWAWRRPRRSDQVEKVFWVDEHGPVAGILLTGSAGGVWQCDPIVVPGGQGPGAQVLWARAIALATEHALKRFDVPVCDGDTVFEDLARSSGLTPGEGDGTAWMDIAQRPEQAEVPAGFVLTDRAHRPAGQHPIASRNGQEVAARLAQCSLYDPWLDLAIETTDGRVAGYSLYWHDPVTKVGLVEPVRVEQPFQRLGLARSMLTAGIERLAARGAARVKVSFETDAAGALYQGLGFHPTSATTWYQWRAGA